MGNRGLVYWAFAGAALLILATALLPALADPPPEQIVKPVAQCDATTCTVSREDWEMFQEFHALKFREIQWANATLDEAQQEINKLRNMLARLAGNCGERRRL